MPLALRTESKSDVFLSFLVFLSALGGRQGRANKGEVNKRGGDSFCPELRGPELAVGRAWSSTTCSCQVLPGVKGAAVL